MSVFHSSVRALRCIKNKGSELVGDAKKTFGARIEYEKYKRTPDLMSPSTFLIVSGAMRSGTTLLGECLYSRYNKYCRHPKLSFANDNILLLRELSARLRKQVTPEILVADPSAVIPFDQNVINEFNELPHGRDVNFFRYRLLREISDVAPCDRLPKVVGIKTTQLLAEYHLMANFFEKTKFIIMMRDPRDVYASCLARNRKMFSGEQLARDIALMNTLTQCNSYKFYNKSDDGNVKIVRYEDLVLNLSETLADVLVFLGLDTEGYDWESLKTVSSANSSYQTQEVKTGSGIFATSIGKYQKELTDVDLSTVEYLTAHLIEDLKYEPIRTDLSLDNMPRSALIGVQNVAATHGVSFDSFEQFLPL